MAGPGVLLVKVLADTSEITKKLDGVQAKLGGFGRGMSTAMLGIAAAGLAIGAALKSSVDAALSWGTQVAKIKRVTGGTAEDSSKLAFALRYVSMDADGAAKSFIKLNAEIFSGGKNLKAMGIESRDAQGNVRPMSELLADISDKVVNTADGQERLNIATTLFGKRAGAEMLPLLTLGKEKMQALSVEAERLGMVLSEEQVGKIRNYKREMNLLGLEWESVKVRLGMLTLTPASLALRSFGDSVNSLGGFLINFAGPVKGITTLQQIATGEFGKATDATKKLADATTSAQQKEEARTGAITELKDAIGRLSTVQDEAANVISKFRGDLIAQTQAHDSAATAVQKLADLQASGTATADELHQAQMDVATATLAAETADRGLATSLQAAVIAASETKGGTEGLIAILALLQSQGVLTADQVATLTAQINAIPPEKSVTIKDNVADAQSHFWSFNQEMDLLFPGGNKYLNLIVTESGGGTGVKKYAGGGWVNFPQFAQIGEEGREFVLSNDMLTGQAPIPLAVQAAIGGTAHMNAGRSSRPIILEHKTYLDTRVIYESIDRYGSGLGPA